MAGGELHAEERERSTGREREAWGRGRREEIGEEKQRRSVER